MQTESELERMRVIARRDVVSAHEATFAEGLAAIERLRNREDFDGALGAAESAINLLGAYLKIGQDDLIHTEADVRVERHVEAEGNQDLRITWALVKRGLKAWNSQLAALRRKKRPLMEMERRG